MANITIKDANRADVVVKTTEVGSPSVHTPHHIIDGMEPGSDAADLGKEEDSAHSTGDVGVMLLAVRKDAAAALAGTDGDYIPLTTDALGRLRIVVGAPTAEGLSVYRNLDLDETGKNVKASAGQVYGLCLSNEGLTSVSSGLYVKLYDKAAAPTVGSDTPVMTIKVKDDGERDIKIPHGLAFASGIGIGCTTGAADNDTGAPSAGEMIAHVLYK